MRRLALPCLLLLLAAPVRAQEANEEAGAAAPQVVVLSVGGDAPPEQAREAREAVAAALEGEGLRVLPEGDLALRVAPARLRGCDSARCAWELGRELGVSMVAAVATWRGDSASITVSLVVGRDRAYAASEDVGEAGLAEAARRALQGAQRARERAMLVEGVGTRPAEEPEDEAEEPSDEAPRGRSVEEYVLPTVLGVVGLALAAGAVYALLPEQCALVGPSGVCLRGNAPNIGLGAVMAITGGLSIAGSILWLVVGGSPPSMGRIDVVLGPEGGGVGWTGHF